MVVRLMSKHLPAISSTSYELNICESVLIRRIPRRHWERLTILITRHVINMCYYVRYADNLIRTELRDSFCPPENIICDF